MIYLTSCNLLYSILFRTTIGLLSTLGIFLLLGKKYINFSRKTFQNQAREFAPANHQIKGKTPTMGGILIIAITIANILVWTDLHTPEPWIMILTLLLFGGIGLLDDLSKVWHKKGISARLKFRLQIICSLCVATSWIWLKNPTPLIFAPFFKGITIDLGWLIVPWIIFIIISMSNAVNLTDGLDGLAIGTLLLNFAFFAGITYFAASSTSTCCTELVVIGAILVGACLGFFWFNAHPAQIFMGDVGSLSLGAALAMMAIMTRQELLLPITGGIFVAETLSVMIQVLSFKILGKRMFRMAPLHHHFELAGWPEAQVTLRFHVITLILCLLAAVMIKIR